MDILHSIILGIVQGLTEFFPVSSSGHLVIIPFFLRWDYGTLLFTVTVHLGTLLALITVYYKDAGRIIKYFFLGIFKPVYRSEPFFKTAIFIIIASVPAALVGVLLEDSIERAFEVPLLVAVSLLFTALVLFLGEKIGKKIQLKKGPKSINYIIALFIGIGQAIAIIPGVSRSGTTISFSRVFGVKREDSVRFSFLLSIPIIFGSFIFELLRSYDSIRISGLQNSFYLFSGLVFSYLSGLFAIKFMIKITRNKNLNYFAIYCILLSIAVFIVYLIR